MLARYMPRQKSPRERALLDPIQQQIVVQPEGPVQPRSEEFGLVGGQRAVLEQPVPQAPRTARLGLLLLEASAQLAQLIFIEQPTQGKKLPSLVEIKVHFPATGVGFVSAKEYSMGGWKRMSAARYCGLQKRKANRLSAGLPAFAGRLLGESVALPRERRLGKLMTGDRPAALGSNFPNSPSRRCFRNAFPKRVSETQS